MQRMTMETDKHDLVIAHATGGRSIQMRSTAHVPTVSEVPAAGDLQMGGCGTAHMHITQPCRQQPCIYLFGFLILLQGGNLVRYNTL
jgi:hypothetical protein